MIKPMVLLLTMCLAGVISCGMGTSESMLFDSRDRNNDGLESEYGIDCPILSGCIPKHSEFSLAAFISRHSYDFPPAATDQIMTVHSLSSFVAQPKQQGPRALLLLGLNAQLSVVTTATPTSIDLVAVFDRSGSMGGAKMNAAVTALGVLVNSLAEGDRFSLVSYASTARVDLALTPVTESAQIQAAIKTLSASGGTNIGAGLELAYQAFGTDTSRTKLVALLSDGQPTIGIVTAAGLNELARGGRTAGIGTSAFAIGEDANSTLMEGLAPAGGGIYYYIDDPAALAVTFQREVERVSRPMADNVQFSFTLDPRYSFKALYGFELKTAGGELRFDIPRAFYEERPGGFIAELHFETGTGNAADWGDLTVDYAPVASTEVTSQTIAFGLPFNPNSDPTAEYHSHHTSRKAYAVLTAGLAIQEAGRLVWVAEDLEAADAHLTEAIAEFDKRTGPLGTDDELVFDRLLLSTLRENIRVILAEMPEPSTSAIAIYSWLRAEKPGTRVHSVDE